MELRSDGPPWLLGRIGTALGYSTERGEGRRSMIPDNTDMSTDGQGCQACRDFSLPSNGYAANVREPVRAPVMGRVELGRVEARKSEGGRRSDDQALRRHRDHSEVQWWKRVRRLRAMGVMSLRRRRVRPSRPCGCPAKSATPRVNPTKMFEGRIRRFSHRSILHTSPLRLSGAGSSSGIHYVSSEM